MTMPQSLQGASKEDTIYAWPDMLGEGSVLEMQLGLRRLCQWCWEGRAEREIKMRTEGFLREEQDVQEILCTCLSIVVKHIPKFVLAESNPFTVFQIC